MKLENIALSQRKRKERKGKGKRRELRGAEDSRINEI